MSHINSPYFVGNDAYRNNLENGLPLISEGLDSVRAYQFEMHFDIPEVVRAAGATIGEDFLTLGAKQVTAVGFSTEAIEVNRVNDKVFYPGKASPEELTVTFDNLYQPQIANLLWQWFSAIYDPTNGKYNSGRTGALGGFKAQRATLVSLDPHGQPLMETRFFGVYPQAWKTAEYNYGQNDFHTIEMTFKYDFMEHVSSSEAAPGGALTSS